MAHYAFRDRPGRSTLYATIPLTLLKGRLRRLKVLSAFVGAASAAIQVARQLPNIAAKAAPTEPSPCVLTL